jgi:hypothetical protein
MPNGLGMSRARSLRSKPVLVALRPGFQRLCRPQTRDSPRLNAVPLDVTRYAYGAGGLTPFPSFPKGASGRGLVRNRMTNTIKTVMPATV